MNGGAGSIDPAAAIEGLNVLLRGELAAVNAYQHALRSAEGRAAVDAAEILRFAAEHQRTVAALQLAVRELGGVPASEAGTWGAFTLLRDTATIRELLEGEEAGLKLCEEANRVLDGASRDLLVLELIPRQRKHIAELSAILSRLSA
ncbi:DUF2383 domain-containing protein [Acidobacteria bacterium ACD]|nr:MAG: DUF2383 domain-containing protein [Acidobacteriota bacterium]MCE7958841.1 DUF2383 domain-containing protein [Acidobacteria bacterium ACB2]MDL1949725.1 DUF2383 domain-containing protein [Acidobacteria bacterium ACD]